METTQNYQMYQSCSDKQLIKAIIAGDMDALYYLVRIKYQKELYAVISKRLTNVLYQYTEPDLEYWLDKFYNDMTVSTKIKKESKFENIKNQDNIQHWICQCCRTFLINDAEFGNLNVHDFDFNQLHTSESVTYSSKHSQNMMKKFIWAVETFNKILTAREKYVVFTYLYCEKKQPDELLHLDKKIALVLNTSEGNIRKIKSVAYDKVRKFFKNSNILMLFLVTFFS
jgi:hypothetical protein